MSKVIPFKTGRQNARTDRYDDEAPQTLAVIQPSTELIGWRIMIVKLRNLEGQVRKFKETAEFLPDSPDKSSAMASLTIALDAIQTQLAICLSEANKLEARLG
ncbi:MAG: hypothetical protein ACLPKB_33485 [Xanthobacteraceae bacterium]